MITSQEGIDLIKEFEGFSAKAYICPAGKATIGYGHVVLPSEKHLLTGSITNEEAERLLKSDLEIAESALNSTKWNKSGGNVLQGLTRRREAEKFLFERGC